MNIYISLELKVPWQLMEWSIRHSRWVVSVDWQYFHLPHSSPASFTSGSQKTLPTNLKGNCFKIFDINQSMLYLLIAFVNLPCQSFKQQNHWQWTWRSMYLGRGNVLYCAWAKGYKWKNIPCFIELVCRSAWAHTVSKLAPFSFLK